MDVISVHFQIDGRFGGSWHLLVFIRAVLDVLDIVEWMEYYGFWMGWVWLGGD